MMDLFLFENNWFISPALPIFQKSIERDRRCSDVIKFRADAASLITFMTFFTLFEPKIRFFCWHGNKADTRVYICWPDLFPSADHWSFLRLLSQVHSRFCSFLARFIEILLPLRSLFLLYPCAARQPLCPAEFHIINTSCDHIFSSEF